MAITRPRWRAAEGTVTAKAAADAGSDATARDAADDDPGKTPRAVADGARHWPVAGL